MKHILIFGIAISMFFVSCNNNGNVKLNTKADTLSYSIGAKISLNLKRDSIENLNVDLLAKAIKDRLVNDTVYLSEKVIDSVLNVFSTERRIAEEEKRTEALKNKFKDNIEAGKAFLAENAKKEGVVYLESGLQYKVIKEGKGNIPTSKDKVKVNYEGTLLDGTVFDSSYERKEPAEFGVTQVIKGWTEALLLMKEGSVWMVYIPENLAYGARQAGNNIKPFSTLIFKVELISIEKSK